MTARLALTRFARSDVATARAWYEAQRGGLGSEFAADFYHALAVIQAHPSAQTLATPPFRKRKLRRFPYHVYFDWDNEVVVVIAVIHRRRSDKFVADQMTRR